MTMCHLASTFESFQEPWYFELQVGQLGPAVEGTKTTRLVISLTQRQSMTSHKTWSGKAGESNFQCSL
jgi:hypothetical protein